MAPEMIPATGKPRPRVTDSRPSRAVLQDSGGSPVLRSWDGQFDYRGKGRGNKLA